MSWDTSVKPLTDGFSIVKKVEVKFSDFLVSQKKECLCGMCLIDPDEIMANLEREYGNSIPTFYNNIYQFVSDAISKEGASIPDFDFPEYCGNCANSFDASRRND